MCYLWTSVLIKFICLYLFSPEEVEEVFAEDYDDVLESLNEAGETEMDGTEIADGEERLVHEAIACPNKWNPYNKCVDYCLEKHGYRTFHPLETLDSKRERMLRKYPLPPHWLEVGDPET